MSGAHPTGKYLWVLDVRALVWHFHDQQGFRLSARAWLAFEGYVGGVPLLGLLHMLKNVPFGIIKSHQAFFEIMGEAYGKTGPELRKLLEAKHIMDTFRFVLQCGVHSMTEVWALFFEANPELLRPQLEALQRRLSGDEDDVEADGIVWRQSFVYHHVVHVVHGTEGDDTIVNDFNTWWAAQVSAEKEQELIGLFMKGDFIFKQFPRLVGLYSSLRRRACDVPADMQCSALARRAAPKVPTLSWLKLMNHELHLTRQNPYQLATTQMVAILDAHVHHRNSEVKAVLLPVVQHFLSFHKEGKTGSCAMIGDEASETKCVPDCKPFVQMMARYPKSVQSHICTANMVKPQMAKICPKPMAEAGIVTATQAAAEQRRAARMRSTVRFLLRQAMSPEHTTRTDDQKLPLHPAAQLRGRRAAGEDAATQTTEDVHRRRGSVKKRRPTGAHAHIHPASKEGRQKLEARANAMSNAAVEMARVFDGQVVVPDHPFCFFTKDGEIYHAAKSRWFSITRAQFSSAFKLTGATAGISAQLRAWSVRRSQAVGFEDACKTLRQAPYGFAGDRRQLAQAWWKKLRPLSRLVRVHVPIMDSTVDDNPTRSMIDVQRGSSTLPVNLQKAVAGFSLSSTSMFSGGKIAGKTYNQIWKHKRGRRPDFVYWLLRDWSTDVSGSQVPDGTLVALFAGVPKGKNPLRFTGSPSVTLAGQTITPAWLEDLWAHLREWAEGETEIAAGVYLMLKKLLRARRRERLHIIVDCHDGDFSAASGLVVVVRVWLEEDRVNGQILDRLIALQHGMKFDKMAERKAQEMESLEPEPAEDYEELQSDDTRISCDLVVLAKKYSTCAAFPLCGVAGSLESRCRRVLSRVVLYTVGGNDVVPSQYGIHVASLCAAWRTRMFQRAAEDGGSLVIDVDHIHHRNVVLLLHVRNITCDSKVWGVLVMAGVVNDDGSTPVENIGWEVVRGYWAAAYPNHPEKVPPTSAHLLMCLSRYEYAYQYAFAGIATPAAPAATGYGFMLGEDGLMQPRWKARSVADLSGAVAAMKAVGGIIAAASDVVTADLARKGNVQVLGNTQKPILIRYPDAAAVEGLVLGVDLGGGRRRVVSSQQKDTLQLLLKALGWSGTGRVRHTMDSTAAVDTRDCVTRGQGRGKCSCCCTKAGTVRQLANAAILLLEARAAAQACDWSV